MQIVRGNLLTARGSAATTVTGLEKVVGEFPNFKIVGVSSDGREALRQVELLTPDIALLDFHMPGLSGIEILLRAKARRCSTAVVFFTTELSDEMIVDVVDAGVSAIIYKSEAV